MKLNDLNLLDEIGKDPANVKGQLAETVLRYREYTQMKRYNWAVVVLTVVIAIGTIIQSSATLTQTWIMQKGFELSQGKTNEEDVNEMKKIQSDQSDSLRKVVERVSTLEKEVHCKTRK